MIYRVSENGYCFYSVNDTLICSMVDYVTLDNENLLKLFMKIMVESRVNSEKGFSYYVIYLRTSFKKETETWEPFGKTESSVDPVLT